MSTLAAARADNFYYPPEWTPNQGSLNKFQGQHPLRQRAKKIGEGIIVIRFEMPFNIWCGGCRSMIAKGVRFNAEKKEIGKYLSSKIWSFKMKAACCKNEIEIQTDPKNAEYVVVSGAEQKVETYDATEAGAVELPGAEERSKVRNDPFSKLENTGRDFGKAKEMAPILTCLQRQSDLKHSDPYRLNRTLRAELRSQKKRIKGEEEEARSKNLHIRLLPPEPGDAKAAALNSYGTGAAAYETNLRKRRAVIKASSIFSVGVGVGSVAATSSAATDAGGSGLKRRAVAASGFGSGAETCHMRTAELVRKREGMDMAGASRLLVGRVAPLLNTTMSKEAGGRGSGSGPAPLTCVARWRVVGKEKKN